jgi:hypothetical protein
MVISRIVANTIKERDPLPKIQAAKGPLNQRQRTKRRGDGSDAAIYQRARMIS